MACLRWQRVWVWVVKMKRRKAYERVSEQVQGKWKQLVSSGDAFADVGGVALWKQLHSALRLQQAMY